MKTLPFDLELLSTKLHSTGIRTAFAVILSLVGFGTAMGQPVGDGRPEESAHRQRVFSEIREAKATGQIRQWSPVLIEIPLRGVPTREMPSPSHQSDTNRWTPTKT